MFQMSLNENKEAFAKLLVAKEVRSKTCSLERSRGRLDKGLASIKVEEDCLSEYCRQGWL